MWQNVFFLKCKRFGPPIYNCLFLARFSIRAFVCPSQLMALMPLQETISSSSETQVHITSSAETISF